MKCIGFAAVTNPATGTSDAPWEHDGEKNLIAALKCLEGLKKVIWRIVEKFEFNPEHRLKLNFSGVNDLRLKQVHHHHMSGADIAQSIVNKVNLFAEGQAIAGVRWFMS